MEQKPCCIILSIVLESFILNFWLTWTVEIPSDESDYLGFVLLLCCYGDCGKVLVERRVFFLLPQQK